MLQCFLEPSAKENGKRKAVFGPGLLLHQLRQRTMKESERAMERRRASSSTTISLADVLAASLITDDDAEVIKSLDRRHFLKLFRWRPAPTLKE
jgi:hypothetical protein